jgi:NAD(P)-dependent dehydrogenase (short-subunit alcohol dehydrogenase family)
MKEQKSGSVANIGSGSNKHPFPRRVSYTARSGIKQFTKVEAIELAEFGIRVNCVAHPCDPATLLSISPLRTDSINVLT